MTFDLNSLPDTGYDLAGKIKASGFTEHLDLQQAMCVAEEAGEFIGAFRRWRGMARRTGPFSDVEDELADVVITSFVCAEVLGIDLRAAIERKLARVNARPFRDAR